jgi:hypothetical protein
MYGDLCPVWGFVPVFKKKQKFFLEKTFQHAENLEKHSLLKFPRTEILILIEVGKFMSHYCQRKKARD